MGLWVTMKGLQGRNLSKVGQAEGMAEVPLCVVIPPPLNQQLSAGGSLSSATCNGAGGAVTGAPQPSPPSTRHPRTTTVPAALGQESVAASQAANTCAVPALLRPARRQLGLRHGAETRQGRAEQMLRCGPGWVV